MVEAGTQSCCGSVRRPPSVARSRGQPAKLQLLQTRPNRRLFEIQRQLRVCHAASGAAASSPQPSRQYPKWLPTKHCTNLLKSNVKLLVDNIWAVLVIYALKDAASFLLHRLSHRMTNATACQLLGIPGSTFANPWWILTDGAFLDANMGYQLLLGVFFLLTLPINIAINAAAASTAAIICAGRVPPEGCQPISSTSSRSSSPEASASSSTDGRSAQGSGTSSVQAAPEAEAETAAAAAAAVAALEEPGAPAAASYWGTPGKIGGVVFRAAAVASCGVSGRCSIGRGETAVASFSQDGGGRSGAVDFHSASRIVKKRPFDEPAPKSPRPGLMECLQGAWAQSRKGWKLVEADLGRVWRTDLLVNAWSLPLQALSLAVVPVFWTFPKLLGIQLTVSSVVLGEDRKLRGQAALKASETLMSGYKATYAYPYVALIGLDRLVELAKQAVLVAVPVRWWQEVVEVPICIIAAFGLLKLLAHRLQDLLPLTAYLIRTRQEKMAQEAAPEASGNVTESGSWDEWVAWKKQGQAM